MNQKQLMALQKKDLVAKCQNKNLDIKGTKFDLVKRLLSSSENTILKAISHKRPVVVIEKDSVGHYIHKPTLLIFDYTTQTVIGKKNTPLDKDILPLEYQDIQNCLRYRFQYRLPDNLSSSSTSCYSNISLKNKDETLHKRLLEIKTPTLDKDDEDDDEEDEEDI